MQKLKALTTYATTFLEVANCQEEVENAGNKALAPLYGCVDLNSGCVDKFMQKVTSVHLNVYHHPLKQLASIVGESTIKCRHGLETRWSLLSGDDLYKVKLCDQNVWSRQQLHNASSK